MRRRAAVPDGDLRHFQSQLWCPAVVMGVKPGTLVKLAVAPAPLNTRLWTTLTGLVRKGFSTKFAVERGGEMNKQKVT